MLKFYFHDGVRAAAAESLPFLLDCAKIRGPTYLQEMWAYICPELLKAIESEPGVATSVFFCPTIAYLDCDKLQFPVFSSSHDRRQQVE